MNGTAEQSVKVAKTLNDVKVTIVQESAKVTKVPQLTNITKTLKDANVTNVPQLTKLTKSLNDTQFSKIVVMVLFATLSSCSAKPAQAFHGQFDDPGNEFKRYGATPVQASVSDDSKENYPADSVRVGVLPVMAYDSDKGLLVAFEFLRYRYQSGQGPFSSFSRVSASYQTIGEYSIYIARDEVRTFRSDIRTWADALVSRNYGNYFIGHTFTDDYSPARFDTSDYYRFKSFTWNIGVASRIPLRPVRDLHRSDIMAGLRFIHEKPFDLDPEGFMAQHRPTGWDGARHVLAETGFVQERRDSETFPAAGYFYKFNIRVALPVISDTHGALFTSDLRGYQRLTGPGRYPYMVFAQRFLMEQSIGELPYWLQPNLGGSFTMRGYMWRRFVGDGFVLSMSEIRAVLFQLPWRNIQVGLNAFVDAGSVYNRSFSDWDPRITAGYAGMFSIAGSDIYLKFEMGFSPEGNGILIGSAYAF